MRLSSDELRLGLLVVSLAAWVVLHLRAVMRLAGTPPRWRSAAALVVPPLAPYWDAKAGRRWSAALWLVTLVTWGLGRLFLAW